MTDSRPVNLTGIPETMLWTLHNRAAEALRKDTFLRDPDCLRIYRAIDYDFERSFAPRPGDRAPRRRSRLPPLHRLRL